MAELWTNAAASTLDADIDSDDTSITLASGEGALFPSPSGGDYFFLALESGPRYNPTAYEIVKVTARSTDTLTVTRAQQGTSGTAFSAGDRAELRITATTLEDIRDRMVARTRLLPPNGFVGANASSGGSADPWGIAPETAVGHSGFPALATTNQLTSTGRAHYVSSSTTSGRRSTGTSRFWRGNSAGLGGFLWTMRFGIPVNNSSTSMFCGLFDQDSFLLASGSPSSLTTREFVGIGFDTSSGTGSNFIIFHNNGSGGTVTQLDTGIARTTSDTILFRLFAEPNGSAIEVTAKNMVSGTTYTASPSSNIPASTTFLYHQQSIRGNGAANSGQIDVCESEYRNIVAA